MWEGHPTTTGSKHKVVTVTGAPIRTYMSKDLVLVVFSFSWTCLV